MKTPPPPDDLSDAAKKAWRAYWRSGVATTEDVDLPVVRRLFSLYTQHERAAEVVKQALVVKGSMGQIRVNPLADHVLKLESAILRLENELGLTPGSRARLGVTLTAPEDVKPPAVIDELAKRRKAV